MKKALLCSTLTLYVIHVVDDLRFQDNFVTYDSGDFVGQHLGGLSLCGEEGADEQGGAEQGFFHT